MQRKTKEITITLRPDNIVETKVNDDITELSLEGVPEVIAATNEVHHSTNAPKAALMHMPSFYVKKSIIKGYASNRDVDVVAVAMLTHSFSSQIIGNLLLTMRSRVLTLRNETPEPSKVFRDKEAAIKWLLEHLAAKKQ